MLALAGVRYVVQLTWHLQNLDRQADEMVANSDRAESHRARESSGSVADDSGNATDERRRARKSSDTGSDRSNKQRNVSAMFRPSARVPLGRAGFGSIVRQIRCILVWALLAFAVQCALALWLICARDFSARTYFVHSAMVHVDEVFLCFVALFAVQRNKRRRPGDTSCVHLCCAGWRRAIERGCGGRCGGRPTTAASEMAE